MQMFVHIRLRGQYALLIKVTSQMGFIYTRLYNMYSCFQRNGKHSYQRITMFIYLSDGYEKKKKVERCRIFRKRLFFCSMKGNCSQRMHSIHVHGSLVFIFPFSFLRTACNCGPENSRYNFIFLFAAKRYYKLSFCTLNAPGENRKL